MFELTPQAIVFLVGVVALTATAAYTDLRYFRIYNWLTLPAFALGWVYQGVFHGWAGLADAGLAFAMGFGLFFVLFAIGSSGGGDTKLMGALSVWLGVKLTIITMVLTVMFVAIAAVAMLIYSGLRRGVRKTKEDLLASRRAGADGRFNRTQTASLRRIGGLMAYAEPIALATWFVLFLDATVLKHGQLEPTPKATVAASQELTHHAQPVRESLPN